MFFYDDIKEMIDIVIRDRGRMKWQGAFFMPEQVKAQDELWRDIQRQK